VRSGARGSGDVSALGGDVHIEKGATIAGEKNHISININGEEFLQKLVGKLFSGEGTRDCELRFTEE
jgi:hypothetical protein